MKRVLSLVLVLVLVFGSIMPAFSEDAAPTAADSQAAQDLMSYDLIAGTDKGLEEASVLTREQMTVILSQLYGKKTEAEVYAFAPSFTDVEEGKWSTPYIAFAEQQGWMSGDAAGGTFRPTDVMKAQEVNAMFVKVLGYTVEWTDVNTKAEELEVAITAADSNSVLRGELFAALRAMLDVPKMDETDTLGTALALTNYLSPIPAAPETVEITGAVAINSVLVEVSLNDDSDAPTAVTADQFTVVDEDDATIEIASVEFAAWDADNYTVLVKLADDVEAGSLYTITSGDTSNNFGGLDEDEDEVASVDADSTDYNELTLTFSEGVDLDTLVVEVEENNSGDELAVVEMAYDGKDVVVLTTDEQSKVLYKVTVTAVEDLSGNSLDDDLTATLVGTKMDDSEQEVASATGNYTDEVLVTFAVNVNENDLDASNFEIVENNDTDEEIVVLEARMITSDDEGYVKADKEKQVILVTENTSKKLYKLTVSDVGTKYGEKMDTDNDDTTFVGVNLPESDFGFATSPEAKSNTVVTMKFPNKMDKDTAEDIANYIIVENNDADEVLVVTAAVLQDDMITVELTVEEMSKVLYKITVENVEDVYGNKIDSDEEDQTFVGAKVADAIDDITAIELDADGVELKVTFNEKVGDNATDIANYSIDEGIGYPTKVVAGDTDYEVVLTIKETVKSEIYKLTVTSLENADGVIMGSDDEVVENFVGKGDAAALAKVVAAEAYNKEMLKVYFDTDVEDIAGLFASDDPDANLLENDVFKVTVGTTTDFDLHDEAHYAVIDETDAKVLIIYAEGAFSFDEDGTDEILDLVVDSTDVDDKNDDASFAYSDDTPSKMDIVAVEAIDSLTLKVYFNQAVRSIDNGFGDVDVDGSGTGTDLSITSWKAANDEYTEWFAILDGEMPGDEKYEFVIQANPDTLIAVTETITDIVVAWDADTTTVEFAGDDTAVDNIGNVYVMMEDEKTIVIIFPEAMDTSVTGTDGSTSVSALDFDNYEVYLVSSGTGAQADMTGSGIDFDNTGDIGEAKWDSDDNTVTLQLKDTFDASYSSVYVKINKTMKNSLGTKFAMDSDDDAYVKQFAVDDTAAAEVAIDGLTANAETQVIEISLTQDITVDNAYTTVTNFTGDFTIKINEVAIDAADISSVSITGDDITVTLNGAMYVAEDAIKVIAKDTTNVNGLFNAEDLEEDSSKIAAATATGTNGPAVNVEYSANAAGMINEIKIIGLSGDITEAVQGDFILAGATAGDDLTITGFSVSGGVAILTVTGQTDVTKTDDTMAWGANAFKVNGTPVAARVAATMTDKALPQVKTITSASNNATNTLAKAGDIVTYTVDFTEPVTVSGLTATTFTNATGALTADLDASNASSDTVSVTIAGGNTGAIDINTTAFTITDSNSNAQAYADRAAVNAHATIPTTVIADTTAPTLDTVSTSDTDGDGKIEYLLTFSEAIKDSTLTATDFLVKDTVSDLTASGAANDDTYTIEANVVDTAAMSITYTQGTLTDAAGNAVITTTVTDGDDTVQPLLVSVQVTIHGATPGFGNDGATDEVVTFTFSEAVRISDTDGTAVTILEKFIFGGGPADVGNLTGGVVSNNASTPATTITVTVNGTVVNPFGTDANDTIDGTNGNFSANEIEDISGADYLDTVTKLPLVIQQ